MYALFCYRPYHQTANGSTAPSVARLPHRRTQQHHNLWEFSGRVTSAAQRPLLDYIQQSQKTDILTPSGVRTHNSSKLEDADPCLIPRDHWDLEITSQNISLMYTDDNYRRKTTMQQNVLFLTGSPLYLEVRTRFWWGNLRDRDHWGDQDVDGRITLRRIFRKWEGVVGTGWGWLGIGTGGGRL